MPWIPWTGTLIRAGFRCARAGPRCGPPRTDRGSTGDETVDDRQAAVKLSPGNLRRGGLSPGPPPIRGRSIPRIRRLSTGCPYGSPATRFCRVPLPLVLSGSQGPIPCQVPARLVQGREPGSPVGDVGPGEPRSCAATRLRATGGSPRLTKPCRTPAPVVPDSSHHPSWTAAAAPGPSRRYRARRRATRWGGTGAGARTAHRSGARTTRNRARALDLTAAAPAAPEPSPPEDHSE